MAVTVVVLVGLGQPEITQELLETVRMVIAQGAAVAVLAVHYWSVHLGMAVMEQAIAHGISHMDVALGAEDPEPHWLAMQEMGVLVLIMVVAVGDAAS